MVGLVSGIVAAIVEALAYFFTSLWFEKALIATAVGVFLFAEIPLLIHFLVPSSIMHALATFADALKSGPSSATCSGAVPLASQGPDQTLTCNSSVSLTIVGKALAYLFNWFQLGTAIQILFPVLAVRFLFRRI